MARVMSESNEIEKDLGVVSLDRSDPEPGRIGTYTFLGATSCMIPLPWVPSALVRRVRGAMVHDLAAHYGLSLSPEARALLAEPSSIEGKKGILSQAFRFAAVQLIGRIGPFAMLPPVRSGLATFLLGHLFQRYLEVQRTSRAVRIDAEEALRVRRAVDEALLAALTRGVQVPARSRNLSPEDLRDQPTQLVDSVLMAIAGAPGWTLARLEAAFDDMLLRKA
jgi:uncharacterized protein (DUF697 family)